VPRARPPILLRARVLRVKGHLVRQLPGKPVQVRQLQVKPVQIKLEQAKPVKARVGRQVLAEEAAAVVEGLVDLPWSKCFP